MWKFKFPFIPENFFEKRESEEKQILCFARQLLWSEVERKEREQPAEFAFSFSKKIPTVEYLPESNAVYKSELDDVYRNMRNLKEPVRNVIFLRYYGKRTYKQIAQCLNKSENWVKYMLHIGKAEIGRKMAWGKSPG